MPTKKEIYNVTESLLPLLVDMKSIKPDPQNARTHPDRNIETIKSSLSHYGQRKPIVVNRPTMHIEAGNGMYEAAKLLGWSKIAVVLVDDDGATAKGYGTIDNKSSDLSEWNLPVLKDILEELDSGAFDMDLTGFDMSELEDLMTAAPPAEDYKFDIPDITWVLICCPTNQYNEIAEHIESIEKIPNVLVESVLSNDKN